MPFSFFLNQVTDDNFVQFLNGWREENKPRILLFDAAASPPFLYKVKFFFLMYEKYTF